MKNKYEILGNEAKVFVNRKGEEIFTLIDVEDLPLIASHKGTWYAQKNNKTGLVYIYTDKKKNKERKTIYLHRLLLNDPHGLHIDHINGDTLDNRRFNLRAVSREENLQNLTRPNKRSKSGVTGVRWIKKSKSWAAQITHDGTNYNIGFFQNKDDAIEAYKLKRSELMPFSKERREIGTEDIKSKLHKLTKMKPRRDSATGIKYVHYEKRKNVYRVVKMINGKHVYFGSFKHIEDAIAMAEKLQKGAVNKK